MRDVDGYARGGAPAIQANGPSTLKDSEHYNLTYAQSHAEQAGTYGIEKQIGLDEVINEFNLNTSDVSTLSSFIDDYFVDRLHINENSTTRVPGNRMQ